MRSRQIFVNTASTVVQFARLDKSALALPNETILDLARRAGAPLGNSCGGTGICARCRVQIIEGADNVSPPTDIEIRTAERNGLGGGERLACQAVVRGPCTIGARYW